MQHTQTRQDERRRHERIGITTHAWLQTGDHQALAVHTRDLSRRGVCLRAVPDSVESWDVVNLSVWLPDTMEDLTLKGVVAWRAGSLMGIAFVELTPAQEARLQGTMDRLLDMVNAHLEELPH